MPYIKRERPNYEHYGLRAIARNNMAIAYTSIYKVYTSISIYMGYRLGDNRNDS